MNALTRSIITSALFSLSVFAQAAIVNVAPGQTRVTLGFKPFGAVFTTKQAANKLLLVSFNTGAIEVVDYANGKPVAQKTVKVQQGSAGIALSPDEKYLVALHSDFNGGTNSIGVYDVTKLLAGSPALINLVNHTKKDIAGNPVGSISVKFSNSGNRIYVVDEYQDRVAVFDFAKLLNPARSATALLSTVKVGSTPVGIDINPAGNIAQVTSQLSTRTNGNFAVNPSTGVSSTVGTLTLIDLIKAETDPARAVKNVLPSGVGSVRVHINNRYPYTYVTAREENRVYKFSRLTNFNPNAKAESLITVGSSPVGIGYAANGSTNGVLVVANSNRWKSNTAGSISLVDGATDAVLKTIPALLFPREVAVASDGNTVAVAEFNSNAVQVLDIKTLLK